jgi:pimeloyl-[acyl-carrier protein] methyl ester esterase
MMAAMYVESYGEGAPLLLIHGWGMHGGIWGNMVDQLSRDFRVICVDLPGNGASEALDDFGLDQLVATLSGQFDEPLAVCGWSLGGQVAMRWAALHPQQVSKLVLLASTPCFVQRADWPHALATEVLQEFSAALLENHAQTLRRFLALQVRGSDDERELLASLRSRLFSRGEPDLAALRGGLEILRATDLRASLPQLQQPALVIAGERDMLTPLAASQYMAQALPAARLVEVAGAAHAPFLSHPELVVDQMVEFLHG